MATENKLLKISKTEKKKNAEQTKAKTSKNPLSFIKLKKIELKPKTNKKIKPNKKNQQKEQNPKKKKRIGKILNVILSLIMILGIGVMVAVLAFCGYIVLNAPSFEADKLYNKESTIFYDRNGNEFARVGSEQRDLATYEELPEVLVDAIVATEDSRFFQHNGFDVVRFMKASLGQIAGQDGAGGASTLTMQVAKNAFSRSEDGKIASSGVEGIIRKFNDIYISIFKIEKNYTKEEIIEFYVNAPFLGNSSYGVKQASQTYFGKSVSDLTLAEASLLAGIFNAPSSYNPFASLTYAEKRRSTVLNLMVRHGYITEEQAEETKKIAVESTIIDNTGVKVNKYQQFIDVVCDEIEEKLGVDPYTTSMQVYTTMDPAMQDIMISLNAGTLGYTWKINRWMKGTDYIQFGGVITDVADGSLRAVNGGRNQVGERLYSRATQMKRQPGSTAKPIFAYGPYLEYNNGNTGTVFYDNKMTYSNGQELANADRTYKGAMTMREALATSRNTTAVQAFQAVDKNKIAEFVNAIGIDYYQYDTNGNVKDTNLYESYAIGGGVEVSPKDMAGAYGSFARGGYYIEPYSFTKVIFQETDEVYEHKYEKVQAMSAETAYMITDILVTATKQGAGGKINIKGTEVASKTGTSTYDYSALKYHKVPTSASADNWVLTYSPDYVISFWYGVDKLSSTSYTDSTDAAIERKKISAVLAKAIYKQNSKFKKPSSIVSAKYEAETIPAELPSDYTPSDLISTELFKKGTEPSNVSERFSQLKNPTNGDYDITNGQINLSWKAIATPDAINDSYLQSYFNENYGQFASIYLEKRREYNNAHIGTVGYQVYLSTANGEQYLGYTNNPYYIYNTTSPGTYTFIIKSAYSIFKNNMSSGLTITAQVIGDTTSSDDSLDGDNTETPSTPSVDEEEGDSLE
ncbi:MAG: penicillin-binding protein [Bacilli bacterium]|nr:penicillin-binding protein [Bacilli bacterium]